MKLLDDVKILCRSVSVLVLAVPAISHSGIMSSRSSLVVFLAISVFDCCGHPGIQCLSVRSTCSI